MHVLFEIKENSDGLHCPPALVLPSQTRLAMMNTPHSADLPGIVRMPKSKRLSPQAGGTFTHTVLGGPPLRTLQEAAGTVSESLP